MTRTQAALVITTMLSLIIAHAQDLAAKTKRTDADIRRFEAVRAFAENVLERGRDRWSGQDTPLLADGIDPLSGEPAVWRYDGDAFIIHNLASQQNLFRVLCGLTNLSGEERYEQAAKDSIRYHFKHLRSPCGKLRWGGHQIIDLRNLKPIGHFDANCHEFKRNFPFYELMWDVDAEATTHFIRAFWAGHVTNWRLLEMNRHAPYGRGPLPGQTVWDKPFDNPQPYFESSGLSFFNCGADLIYAGGLLYHLAGEQGALDWALRLASMYTKARHPKTGMGAYQYTKPRRLLLPPAQGPLTGTLTYSHFGDRIENKFGHSGSSDPQDEFYNPIRHKMADDGMLVAREGWVWSISGGFPWYALMQLALAEAIGEPAGTLAADAADHLEAHARHAYDPRANHFRPMWADGTDVSGLKIPRTGYGVGNEGDFYSPTRATPTHLTAYLRAYRLTERAALWQTARAISRGLGLGEIGQTRALGVAPCGATPAPSPELIFALLELYRISPNSGTLDAARAIADRMLALQFHHGFFMPSPKHQYANFDAEEPLAILALDALLRGEPDSVAIYVGGRGYIHGRFDGRGRTYDHVAVWSQVRPVEK